MRLISKSNVITIAVVAGIVATSSTGGAVAGALITGRQIKDGTITGADIRNSTVRSADLKDGSVTAQDLSAATRGALRTISKPTIVEASDQDVPPGETRNVTATCPAGRTGVSGSAGWFGGSSAIAYPSADGQSWTAYGRNEDNSNDNLYLTIICVKVS